MAQQHGRRGDKMPTPKERAERMTERMVKEYSLNDSQKAQLLEANMTLMEKMDKRAEKKEDLKAKPTDEERAQMKAARADYDARLQKIMTKEQYAAYDKNMKERKDRTSSGRRGGPRQ